MVSKLNKPAYEKLIREDIEAVIASNCPSLEKEHIIDVLRDSVHCYYPPNEPQRTKPPVYNHFKFNVGDFVISSFLAQATGVSRREILSDTYQVIERLYQECPGGVQLHYICRSQNMFMGSREYVRFNEIELAPFVDPQKDED